MLDMHCEMIMNEYRSNQEIYETIKTVCVNNLKNLVRGAGIYVTALEGRVKTEKSLEGKLELKGYKYKNISDITDIVGCRVITFYGEEVDKISSLVESSFDVDWNESVDKRKVLDPDRFGYMSLHYICKIPKKMYFDPDHPELNDVRFEIQMRTALQHVWATAYHDIGYKSDIEIPVDYIRKLSRLAGVLEIADEQFSQIIGEIKDYRRKVFELVQNGKFENLNLDGDTFSSYMRLNPFDKLNERIASVNHAEIQENSYAQYLGIFKSFGFKTVADIENLKKECSDGAYKLAVLQLGGTDLDVLSSTIGMQNLCIVYILKQGKGVDGLKEFYDMLYGERSRNLNSAKRIYDQAQSIALV